MIRPDEPARQHEVGDNRKGLHFTIASMRLTEHVHLVGSERTLAVDRIAGLNRPANLT